jgi:hypothetical protein
MWSNSTITINQSSPCHCGSPLHLDVLSLNRKLLGDASSKQYCLDCMPGLSTATSEFVLNQELLLSAHAQKGYNPAHDDARM